MSTAPPAPPPHQGSGGGAPEGDAKSLLECNVCLDTARDPVVTMCGHLYCWPCLFRWLRSGHTTCPVCKAGVSRESVIPLYGRGSSGPSRAAGSDAERPAGPPGVPAEGAAGGADGDIPARPAGQRMEPPPRQEDPWGAGGGGGGASFTVGYGFFPSLFGLQFHTVGGLGPGGPGAPQSREALQQQMVSRALIGVGVAMVLMLMLL